MAIGPVEYIILGFPGNQFNGEIAPELAKLVDSGTIRVLDLVFITKDADGNVAAVELEDHHDVALFNALEGEVGGLISEEDIEYAAAELEPNSSAALLIWEDVWATPFVEALRASGAALIEGSRIPHDLIEAAEAELARRLTVHHDRFTFKETDHAATPSTCPSRRHHLGGSGPAWSPVGLFKAIAAKARVDLGRRSEVLEMSETLVGQSRWDGELWRRSRGSRSRPSRRLMATLRHRAPEMVGPHALRPP